MESHLHWADYLILVGFLVISLAIGIYHSLTGGRQKTTAEFIMGNRQLKVIPTSISLLISIVSAILLLGTAAETYSYGIQHIIFFTISAALALLFTERFIVPWLYPLKLVSVYDVSLLFVFFRNCNIM
jgi:Na+/proline symporter